MSSTDHIMKWIVGFATAIALGLGGWNLNTTASNQSRLGVVEERSDSVIRRLDRMEDKIDRLLERRH